jgi:hypothetical protein
LKQLRAAIRALPNKSAPGLDRIHNCMLKHMPPVLVNYFLEINHQL